MIPPIPPLCLPIGLACCAALGACGRDAWRPLDRARLDARQELQRERALAAQNLVAARLMQRLTAAITADGPAAAIDVCSDAAPEIAAAVAAEQGLAIGRTSWKLRNPDNTAPPWAADLLDARPDKECLVEGPEDQLGLLLPLHVMSTCLTCHGTPDQLGEGVARALADGYPNDRATGFTDGDLRGWFWVEVPTPGG